MLGNYLVQDKVAVAKVYKIEEGFINDVSSLDFEPILLDDYWKKRLGFKQEEDDYIWFINGNFTITDSFLNVFDENGDIIQNFELPLYVHELQNYMRLYS